MSDFLYADRVLKDLNSGRDVSELTTKGSETSGRIVSMGVPSFQIALASILKGRVLPP